MCRLCKNTGKYRGISGGVNYCACSQGQAAKIRDRLSPSARASLTQVEQISWAVRKRAEEYAQRYKYSATLQHMCGLVSVALFVALRRAGIPAQIAEGFAYSTDHVWVLHRGLIVDLTYTQFNRKGDPVLIRKERETSSYVRLYLHRKPKPLATSMSGPKWQKHVELVAGVPM